MIDAKTLLDIAFSEIGYIEKNNDDLLSLYTKTENIGANNNYTKYAYEMNTKYKSVFNGSKQGMAYCCTFVIWLFCNAFGQEKAQKMLKIPNNSLAARVDYFKNYMAAYDLVGDTPHVGDVVFFGNQHVGLVDWVSDDAKRFSAIEGNTTSAHAVIPNGNGVFEKVYNTIQPGVSFGTPDWSVIGGSGMIKKIYLSPSDQTSNSYPSDCLYNGKKTNEAEQMRRVAMAADAALKRCGFDTINNMTESMQDRIAESNKWGADLHLPIHSNAANGQVSGTRMFSYNTTGGGYKACQSIFKYVDAISPGTSSNIKANPSLSEIKNTDAVCAYIEVDFHDVPEVAKWIIGSVNEIGEAIAMGVCDYYGVEYVKPTDNVDSWVTVGRFLVKDDGNQLLIKTK